MWGFSEAVPPQALGTHQGTRELVGKVTEHIRTLIHSSNPREEAGSGHFA